MNPLPSLSQESMTTISEEQPVKQFLSLFCLCLFVGFWRIQLYIKMSQQVAETVDLDLLLLILVVKMYFS